jgi:hypothetical protein
MSFAAAAVSSFGPKSPHEEASVKARAINDTRKISPNCETVDLIEKSGYL